MEDKFKKILELFPENLRKRILSAVIIVPIVIIIICSWQLFFNTFIVSLAVFMGYEWITIAYEEDKKTNKWKFLGLLYIISPCFSLMYLKSLNGGEDLIIWLLLVVIATDTAGMLVGGRFGGPKLAPSISPKKTWSGLAGGIIVSMMVGFLLSFIIFGDVILYTLFSGILAIVEQCSDLLESKFKRYFGVKDSGNLIPGHGGILDRVDGLTLTAPLIVLFSIIKGF
ncbi:MAG: phosphatidate cytidylyltransferase [Rickettsiales bacterium]|nr:phosphatidate cytidylyltransferase [Rickettsiales bacterium]